MKLLTITFFMLSALAICAQEFTLSNELSNISWTGKAAYNSYSLTGSLQTIMGSTEIKNDSLIQLEVAFDMKSLDHSDAQLKAHLRSPDFFETKKYRTATFSLVEPCLIEDNSTLVKGVLTIKDESHVESFPIKLKLNEQLVCELNLDIDRTKYGVTYNSPNYFEGLKDQAIADFFNLSGSLVFK